MTKPEALGRWLQLNPEVMKRHTVSTWRLAGPGDVLGWTLMVDANAVLVGQVNAKSSGANRAPIPAEPSRVSVEEVRSWSIQEAMQKIDAEEATDRDLNALYRTNGGNPRVTWTAFTEIDEMPGEDTGEFITGIPVVSAHSFGLVPLERVVTGRRNIVIDRAEIAPLNEPGEGRLNGPSALEKDGLPDMTTAEKVRQAMSSDDSA